MSCPDHQKFADFAERPEAGRSDARLSVNEIRTNS